jgi:two-component system sensor histidine kinase CpxA
MRSLFLRIFLSFWTAQALLVISAIVLTIALRPREEDVLPAGTAAQVAATFELNGQAALREQLRQVEQPRHLRLFLFDGGWREVSGRPVPDWMEGMLSGRQPKPRGLPGLLLPFHFVKQQTAGLSGRPYTLVAELPPNPVFFLGRGGSHGWGMLVAVLTSGLVCYLLTSYLTGPIVKLRAATLRLAAGDLTARAGAAGLKNRRRDEIGGLVRDFDAMAERLETLVNEQNRLLNDISHELRSPLARLNVALGLARQRTGPDAIGVLARIELESTRLEEMIDRLLTLSRLEAGQALLDRSSLRLGELIQEIVKDADFEAQSRHCHVRYNVEREAEITGSPSLLRSAIENVVRNAMRYTREGSDVDVSLEVETNSPETAVIRVCDHGPGVPEAALDKLFRPFFRVDDARGRQTGGSGLGLAITDRAVRLHGGTVSAANQANGGLCVEIRLPLLAQNS